jgi:flagellar biosynthesis/type III secretory pathway protein FliH
VETILSDQAPAPVWSAHPLLQSTAQKAHFQRHGWDEAQTEAFGPWRFSPKQDPLAGQTETLIASEVPLDSDVIVPEGPDAGDGQVHEPASATLGLSQDELDQMLEQTRAQSWQTGYDAAIQELTVGVDADRQALQAAAKALHDLQSNQQRWFEPLKKLSLHIAQELVRGEMQLSSAVIERLIKGCIEALDQPAETTLIQVGHADMHRLRDLNLPGIALELDESLSEGSVRAKVSDTQVQDLIEHRLAQMSQQLLQGNA